MVGKVVKGDPLKDFQGYTAAAETEKKLLRDVFTHGDVFFSSGWLFLGLLLLLLLLIGRGSR